MDGRNVKLLCLSACAFLGTLGCRKELRSPMQPSFPSGTQPLSGIPMTTAKKPFWGSNTQPAAPVEVAAEPPKKGPPTPDTRCAFADVQLEAALDEKKPPGDREALLDAARIGYQKALEQDPKNKRAILGLARFYSRLGDTGKSVEMYKQYLTYYPNDKDIAHEVAKAHAKWKDWEGAVAWCQFTLRIDPENLAARKTMAFCMTRLGKWEDAFHLLCEFLPEPQARYLMASALRHHNRVNEARQQLQLALQIDPDHADARALLAELDAPPAPQGQGDVRTVDYRDQ